LKKDYNIILRGHHLLSFHAYLISGETETRACLIKDHSNEVVDKVIKTFRKIVNSNIRIKIIDSVDGICRSCDTRTKECKQEIPFRICAVSEDRKIASKYGLKINKSYSSKYILRKITQKEWQEIIF